MKKVITIVLVLAGIAAIAFILAGNKEAMAEKAKLSEEVSDIIPVELGKVKRKNMEANVAAIGTFEAVTDLTMLSQTDGLITKIYHKKGDFVKKGTILAQVENESLQAQAEAAKANLDKANIDLTRFGTLAEKDAVTQRQLEDARITASNAEAQYKNLKKSLEDTYIRATATGRIDEDYVQDGSNIAKNNELFDIVDVSKLKLNISLTANNILQVREGDKIRITTEMYPTQKFEGIVTAIAAKADKSLKYNVELLMENSDQKPLKAGMFGSAHFGFTNPTDALYFDRDALTGSIKDPTVFVMKDGRAILEKIKIGEIFEDEVQVLAGLNEGDQVVVNGQINLKDSTRVKDINDRSKTNATVAKN